MQEIKKNVIAVDELVLSQQGELQIQSSFNTPSSTSWCHTDDIFHGDLGSKCLKRRLPKN